MNKLSLFIFFAFCACSDLNSRSKKDNHDIIVADESMRKDLFEKIASVDELNALETNPDSIAFLMLPIDASCPACRDKVVDSIHKYKSRFSGKRFVIISGSSKRIINAYFKKRSGQEVTVNANGIFLDTLNQAYNLSLTSENPVIYYISKGEVYRKVQCRPSTIKKDLKEYFLGL